MVNVMANNGNYIAPKVTDGDNTWDGVINSTFWTVSGTQNSMSESNGAIIDSISGSYNPSSASNCRCLIDLKTLYKVNLFVSSFSGSQCGSASGSSGSSFTLKLTDGASNNLNLVVYSTSAGGNNYVNGGQAGFGGMFSFTLNGNNLNVKHNLAYSNTSETNSGGSSIITVIATNTNQDISTWAHIYVDVAATNSSNTATSVLKYNIGPFEIVPFFLGSKGTA